MRLRIGYPDAASEREILRNVRPGSDHFEPVLTGEELLRLQAAVDGVTRGGCPGGLHARHCGEDPRSTSRSPSA
jgi:hypothetical protein